MLAPDEARIVERYVFQQLDIRSHGDPGIRALNQIVTEQGFGRKAIRKHGPERLSIVDRLAMKDAFAEQVLLHVGYGAAIRIGAGGIGHDLREPRGRGAGQRYAHTRLDDGVTALARAGIGIQKNLIERMRDGFHHPPRRSGRQLSVGVQGDDVADLPRKAPGLKDLQAVTPG